MRTLYLVSKRLPRVCMGGSGDGTVSFEKIGSAPRVHGWFLMRRTKNQQRVVCPACAWVVPNPVQHHRENQRLPRVCMGGSSSTASNQGASESAPRVHGWFLEAKVPGGPGGVCPACAWVVPVAAAAKTIAICLPRVCMGGSFQTAGTNYEAASAPRVHGWFPSHQ